MTSPRIDAERLSKVLINTLLADALKELTAAFASANKEAAVFTVSTLEQELLARARALTDGGAGAVPDAIRAEVVAQLAKVMSALARAAENASVQ
jgi:hypothetical protein